MRIISGIYGSRLLKSPATNKVRPTSDRAKETLFNILSNKFNFEGITCMDIFCGSGSLGLECISRGASMCWFVDTDTKLVSENITNLKAEDKCKVFRSDALDFLKRHDAEQTGLIFCDPPYKYEFHNEILASVSSMKSLFILEHSEEFLPDNRFEKFIMLRKKIGAVNFTIFDFR